jgi:uncharacterized protein
LKEEKVMPIIPGKLAYVELAVKDSEASAAFFESVFGWELARYGPSYAGTVKEPTELGLQADVTEQSEAPLAGIQVEDLEAAQAAVEAAGGVISRSIFSYPGGRRFHFREPGGNELAIFVQETS